MAMVFLVATLLVILGVSVAWTIPRGAPWVPSSPETVRKMLRLAELKPGEILYDLGCGDGRILIAAALDFKARAVGIEIDPLRCAWCWLLKSVLGLHEQVRLIRGDLFRVDLSQADVVAIYLLPDALKKLEAKLLRELRPGTRVVSNTFVFNQVQEAKRDGKARLYLFSPEFTLSETLKKQLESTAGEEQNPCDHS